MRGKLIAFVIFCIVYLVLWSGIKSPLTQSWTAESRIKITARIIEEPEQTDSKTIIRKGIWKVQQRGYVPLEIGREYAFSGRVEPEVLVGKTVRIVMIEPEFLPVKGTDPSVWERGVMALGRMRES